MALSLKVNSIISERRILCRLSECLINLNRTSFELFLFHDVVKKSKQGETVTYRDDMQDETRSNTMNQSDETPRNSMNPHEQKKQKRDETT